MKLIGNIPGWLNRRSDKKPMTETITLPVEVLLPPDWFGGRTPSDFYVFNPAITCYQGQLLMVYRVDFGREKMARVACAVCRLDDNFRVIPGSIVPLSDTITADEENHFDPRFLIYQNRLFIHYNNNYDTSPNRLYLVELDPDTLAVRSPARLLALDGPRREIEKNWMFFQHEDELLAVYTVAPHIILRAELTGAGPVVCRPVFQTDWDVSAYTARWGEPRGGTPPVRAGDSYIAFFHSRTLPHRLAPVNPSPTMARVNHVGWVRSLKRRLREWLDPLRYHGGVYTFAAVPPFAPTFIRPIPILWPEREGRRQRPTASHLSPRRVVYPCGLVQLDYNRWLVSYGVHDERCALRIFTHRDLFGPTGVGTGTDNG